jgi:uncharacterized protein (DUF3084 family)
LPENNNQNQEPTGEELENATARVVELEELVVSKEKELAARNSRISELEQDVASRDNQIAALKQSLSELEPRLTELESSLSQAVSSYQALVIKSNPGVPEELVAGNSIEEIDHSLASAQTLIDRVRQELETEIAAAKIPAGAPQRIPIDLSALSPKEKIQYAIGERR